MRLALASGMIVKDGTTLNSQFMGVHPIQIDTGSFEAYSQGTWPGYAQFTRTFLNPLMLQALAGVPFQPWLRGSPMGLDAAQLRRLIPLRHRFRRDVIIHVMAQSWLERTVGSELPGVVPAEDAHRRRSIERLVDQLERSVRSLSRPTVGGSPWLSYSTQCHYASDAVAAKRRFVEETLRSVEPAVVWDLGCNDGEYSLLAASYAQYVVAMDSDEQSVGRLARRLEEADEQRVLPLVIDLTNPSPSQGWAGAELTSIGARGPADFVLCLALLHHLVIGNNVPMAYVVDWLAQHSAGGVIEFVPTSDPMTQQLLRTRKADVATYTQENFENILETHFAIVDRLNLPASERVLYAVVRRQQPG
jgi:hypothetical protein